MMNDAIKIRCKHCGRQADSESFVLDPIYGMLVCPMCVKERRSRKVVSRPQPAARSEENKAPEKPKPAGWDREDDYLAKSYASKMRETATAKRIDDEWAMYTCKSCNYQFKYNLIKESPGRCPYCSADVAKRIKTI
jgi:rubrerythrin